MVQSRWQTSRYQSLLEVHAHNPVVACVHGSCSGEKLNAQLGIQAQLLISCSSRVQHSTERCLFGTAQHPASLRRVWWGQVGPLRPVVWFRFHNRAEARRWAGLPRFRPKLVWQGSDPDLHPRHPGPSPSSAGAADTTRSHSGGEQDVKPAVKPMY